MKQLLIPGLKLFIICLVAALLLGLINSVTKGPIKDAEAEKVNTALSELHFEGDMQEGYIAPPAELLKTDLETQLLSKMENNDDKEKIKSLYQSKDENTFELKSNLTVQDIIEAGKIFTKKDYKSKAAVRKIFPLENNNQVSGFILEVWGLGYGGELKLFAVYDKDGTIRDAQLVKDSETPGLGKKAHDKGYMDKYLGTKGKTVPVIKAMLKDPDSVTGATITFMGVADALRNGSRYIILFGENNEAKTVH